MTQSQLSLPFLASRAKGQLRHRLVSAGPSIHSSRKNASHLSTVPGLARSAVRVPAPLAAEPATGGEASSFPHLFVHEGARQQLERALRRTLGKRIVLSITDNRRTMLSAQPVSGGLLVRVHHMFLDADPFTQAALGRYLRAGDRAASTIVGAYIDANLQRIRPPKKRQRELRTRGQKHDLSAIFDRLNDTYFQGMVDAHITWGRRTRAVAPCRTSIKLGTYCPDRKLIRIHPALDRALVPRYFVEFVVFHEMLHHMMPMPVVAGRRELHSVAFRQSEQRFRHYARAIAWEEKNLGRLLRY